MSEEKIEIKSYGKITAGLGTKEEKELDIIDFVQTKFIDNRHITIAQLEDESYFIAVENLPSSGRAISSNLRLTKESLMGLFSSISLYWGIKGEDSSKLLKDASYLKGIDYSYSDNLTDLLAETMEKEKSNTP